VIVLTSLFNIKLRYKHIVMLPFKFTLTRDQIQAYDDQIKADNIKLGLKRCKILEVSHPAYERASDGAPI